MTSISRSSVLRPEYSQALSNEHVQAAASRRLAAVYGFREHVDAGGLISYGVNLADNFRRAATYVEFPNKLELIINLETSKALGGRPFADTGSRGRTR